ncbi:MAG: pyridoxamine 5'-phosphate oxidase family protein [Halobacteriota archaeon]
MDRDACERVLFREGHGFLALSDDDIPYVIPMSFGYDGTDCFIQMTTGGRKNEALGDGDRVSLAVLSTDYETGISESVLVDGTMALVPEAAVEDGLAALAANAEFGTDLSVWGEPVQDVDLALYRLSVAELSGRRFAPGEPRF